MIKEEIKKIISQAVKKIYSKERVEILVESPKEKMRGDYSTNIAFLIAKDMAVNPFEIATLLKTETERQRASFIKEIEVVNGFINFFISDKFFIDNLKNINKDYGKGNELKKKKVIIDYTDPNPFKEFHIGHLMSNAIGESLSRIFEFQGAKVKRVCYQGDVGIHVAKAIWAMMKQSNITSSGGAIIYNPKDAFAFGKAYSRGDLAYRNDELAKREIIEINKKLYNFDPKKTYPTFSVEGWYEEGKKISLKHFDEIYKKLGTKFDYFIFESQTGKIGKKIVEKGLKNGVFEKGDNGAIIFKGEKYGLHTRVFINSEGLPTYEAKDLGLAEIKYKKYAYDQSVIVTGNEVNDYFKVMLCAMSQTNLKLAEKTKHIGHGMLRLPEGKMSSRTGKVITGESLIEKVEELVKEKIKDRELLEKEKKEITEAVAVGAIRYSILKQSIGSDIIYDFDKSISFEGDSGPYLQYSYTRAGSVLKKARKEGIRPSFKKLPEQVSSFEKMMFYFPEALKKAVDHYQPHYILMYLTELASAFNSYYAKNKIVDKKDELSLYKVALTNAFATIMKNGMWLLGINPLEKM